MQKVIPSTLLLFIIIIILLVLNLIPFLINYLLV